ncbi:unnamed protein product, partial [Meganyctiphanes norvegica]
GCFWKAVSANHNKVLLPKFQDKCNTSVLQSCTSMQTFIISGIEDLKHKQPPRLCRRDVLSMGAARNDSYIICQMMSIGLGKGHVTWMRKKDTHILTVSLFTYTTDQRFTALHSESSDQWSLRIASAQKSDSGIYECQVSTEPKISAAFTLQVVESSATINGPSEVHMVSGSDIRLTCQVNGTPEAPNYIYWYRDGSLINYSSRGGISVVTDKNDQTSRLVVTRARPADSGNYTCSPANAKPDSVSVYILQDGHPMQAIHGGCSSCSARFSLVLFLLLQLLRLSIIHCGNTNCTPRICIFILLLSLGVITTLC